MPTYRVRVKAVEVHIYEKEFEAENENAAQELADQEAQDEAGGWVRCDEDYHTECYVSDITEVIEAETSE